MGWDVSPILQGTAKLSCDRPRHVSDRRKAFQHPSPFVGSRSMLRIAGINFRIAGVNFGLPILDFGF
jgi:hypothetical protein